MIKISKLIFWLIIVFVIWFAVLLNRGNGAEQQSFIIKEGQGVNEISVNLEQAGLLKSKFVFETWLWAKKAEDQVKAGVYLVPADISIRRLSNLILKVPSNQQQSLTIIEGWHRRWPQLQTVLEKHDFDYQEFLQLTAKKSDWQANYDFLTDAASNASLEGYLYPDTYFIDQNTSLENLIAKALNNFDKKLTTELRQEIANQNKTIFEVISLASIIEREVSKDEDKQMIADIFLKRLEIGMGLQSDATINFITNKGLARPTLEDLAVDSPYNTYKYRGLPPGPISNPSISSIEAVIYPTANDYYYFLTTEEGQIIFAETHDQHVSNKAKYLN
jgi:UPF0755 protein